MKKPIGEGNTRSCSIWVLEAKLTWFSGLV